MLRPEELASEHSTRLRCTESVPPVLASLNRHLGTTTKYSYRPGGWRSRKPPTLPWPLCWPQCVPALQVSILLVHPGDNVEAPRRPDARGQGRLAPLREAVMERIVSIASLVPASPRKSRRMRISGTPGGPSGC